MAKVATKKFIEITFEDILAHSAANGNNKWLKEFKASFVKHEKYPRKSIVKKGKDGKERRVSVLDKSQAPTVVMEHPSVAEIKTAYVKQFMQDICPSVEKKPTVFDLIDALDD